MSFLRLGKGNSHPAHLVSVSPTSYITNTGSGYSCAWEHFCFWGEKKRKTRQTFWDSWTKWEIIMKPREFASRLKWKDLWLEGCLYLSTAESQVSTWTAERNPCRSTSSNNTDWQTPKRGWSCREAQARPQRYNFSPLTPSLNYNLNSIIQSCPILSQMHISPKGIKTWPFISLIRNVMSPSQDHNSLLN